MHWEDPEELGREGGGGGSGWGTHVNPWLIHVNVWQKPLQYCKVISFQLIKINGKKKKNPPYVCYSGDIRDASVIPGLGISPGEGNGNPLQYSCLGNPMDREIWRARVHGVTKSWTWLHTRASSLETILLLIFQPEGLLSIFLSILHWIGFRNFVECRWWKWTFLLYFLS